MGAIRNVTIRQIANAMYDELETRIADRDFDGEEFSISAGYHGVRVKYTYVVPWEELETEEEHS